MSTDSSMPTTSSLPSSSPLLSLPFTSNSSVNTSSIPSSSTSSSSISNTNSTIFHLELVLLLKTLKIIKERNDEALLYNFFSSLNKKLFLLSNSSLSYLFTHKLNQTDTKKSKEKNENNSMHLKKNIFLDNFFYRLKYDSLFNSLSADDFIKSNESNSNFFFDNDADLITHSIKNDITSNKEIINEFEINLQRHESSLIYSRLFDTALDLLDTKLFNSQLEVEKENSENLFDKNLKEYFETCLLIALKSSRLSYFLKILIFLTKLNTFNYKIPINSFILDEFLSFKNNIIKKYYPSYLTKINKSSANDNNNNEKNEVSYFKMLYNNHKLSRKISLLSNYNYVNDTSLISHFSKSFSNSNRVVLCFGKSDHAKLGLGLGSYSPNFFGYYDTFYSSHSNLNSLSNSSSTVTSSSSILNHFNHNNYHLNRYIPTLIPSLSNKKIIKVASMSTYTLALNDSGDIYYWGSSPSSNNNNVSIPSSPSSNLNNISSLTSPIIIPLPTILPIISSSIKIIDISCGLAHALFLSTFGKVYSWGNGGCGRLGVGDTKDYYEALQVSGPINNEIVISIQCGASHSMALTNSGKVYCWGKNTQGQCSQGHLDDVLIPTLVRASPSQLTTSSFLLEKSKENSQALKTSPNINDHKVVQLAAGWEHSLALTSDGILFAWGGGYRDSRRGIVPPVLGIGHGDPTPYPEILTSFLPPLISIKSIVSGWDHCIAIDNNGKLLSWGSGQNGKLGLGSEENFSIPCYISEDLIDSKIKDNQNNDFKNEVIINVSAGCEHSAAITSKGNLYTWGHGDGGRLGHGSNTQNYYPKKVEAINLMGLNPLYVHCGDKFTILIAENKKDSYIELNDFIVKNENKNLLISKEKETAKETINNYSLEDDASYILDEFNNIDLTNLNSKVKKIENFETNKLFSLLLSSISTSSLPHLLSSYVEKDFFDEKIEQDNNTKIEIIGEQLMKDFNQIELFKSYNFGDKELSIECSSQSLSSLLFLLNSYTRVFYKNLNDIFPNFEIGNFLKNKFTYDNLIYDFKKNLKFNSYDENILKTLLHLLCLIYSNLLPLKKFQNKSNDLYDISYSNSNLSFDASLFSNISLNFNIEEFEKIVPKPIEKSEIEIISQKNEDKFNDIAPHNSLDNNSPISPTNEIDEFTQEQHVLYETFSQSKFTKSYNNKNNNQDDYEEHNQSDASAYGPTFPHGDDSEHEQDYGDYDHDYSRNEKYSDESSSKSNASFSSSSYCSTNSSDTEESYSNFSINDSSFIQFDENEGLEFFSKMINDKSINTTNKNNDNDDIKESTPSNNFFEPQLCLKYSILKLITYTYTYFSICSYNINDIDAKNDPKFIFFINSLYNIWELCQNIIHIGFPFFFNKNSILPLISINSSNNLFIPLLPGWFKQKFGSTEFDNSLEIYFEKEINFLLEQPVSNINSSRTENDIINNNLIFSLEENMSFDGDTNTNNSNKFFNIKSQIKAKSSEFPFNFFLESLISSFEFFYHSINNINKKIILLYKENLAFNINYYKVYVRLLKLYFHYINILLNILIKFNQKLLHSASKFINNSQYQDLKTLNFENIFLLISKIIELNIVNCSDIYQSFSNEKDFFHLKKFYYLQCNSILDQINSNIEIIFHSELSSNQILFQFSASIESFFRILHIISSFSNFSFSINASNDQNNEKIIQIFSETKVILSYIVNKLYNFYYQNSHFIYEKFHLKDETVFFSENIFNISSLSNSSIINIIEKNLLTSKYLDQNFIFNLEKYDFYANYSDEDKKINGSKIMFSLFFRNFIKFNNLFFGKNEIKNDYKQNSFIKKYFIREKFYDQNFNNHFSVYYDDNINSSLTKNEILNLFQYSIDILIQSDLFSETHEVISKKLSSKDFCTSYFSSSILVICNYILLISSQNNLQSFNTQFLTRDDKISVERIYMFIFLFLYNDKLKNRNNKDPIINQINSEYLVSISLSSLIYTSLLIFPYIVSSNASLFSSFLSSKEDGNLPVLLSTLNFTFKISEVDEKLSKMQGLRYCLDLYYDPEINNLISKITSKDEILLNDKISFVNYSYSIFKDLFHFSSLSQIENFSDISSLKIFNKSFPLIILLKEIFFCSISNILLNNLSNRIKKISESLILWFIETFYNYPIVINNVYSNTCFFYKNNRKKDNPFIHLNFNNDIHTTFNHMLYEDFDQYLDDLLASFSKEINSSLNKNIGSILSSTLTPPLTPSPQPAKLNTPTIKSPQSALSPIRSPLKTPQSMSKEKSTVISSGPNNTSNSINKPQIKNPLIINKSILEYFNILFIKLNILSKINQNIFDRQNLKTLFNHKIWIIINNELEIYYSNMLSAFINGDECAQNLPGIYEKFILLLNLIKCYFKLINQVNYLEPSNNIFLLQKEVIKFSNYFSNTLSNFSYFLIKKTAKSFFNGENYLISPNSYCLDINFPIIIPNSISISNDFNISFKLFLPEYYDDINFIKKNFLYIERVNESNKLNKSSNSLKSTELYIKNFLVKYSETSNYNLLNFLTNSPIDLTGFSLMFSLVYDGVSKKFYILLTCIVSNNKKEKLYMNAKKSIPCKVIIKRVLRKFYLVSRSLNINQWNEISCSINQSSLNSNFFYSNNMGTNPNINSNHSFYNIFYSQVKKKNILKYSSINVLYKKKINYFYKKINARIKMLKTNSNSNSNSISKLTSLLKNLRIYYTLLLPALKKWKLQWSPHNLLNSHITRVTLVLNSSISSQSEALGSLAGGGSGSGNNQNILLGSIPSSINNNLNYDISSITNENFIELLNESNQTKYQNFQFSTNLHDLLDRKFIEISELNLCSSIPCQKNTSEFNFVNDFDFVHSFDKDSNMAVVTNPIISQLSFTSLSTILYSLLEVMNLYNCNFIQYYKLISKKPPSENENFFDLIKNNILNLTSYFQTSLLCGSSSLQLSSIKLFSIIVSNLPSKDNNLLLKKEMYSKIGASSPTTTSYIENSQNEVLNEYQYYDEKNTLIDPYEAVISSFKFLLEFLFLQSDYYIMISNEKSEEESLIYLDLLNYSLSNLINNTFSLSYFDNNIENLDQFFYYYSVKSIILKNGCLNFLQLDSFYQPLFETSNQFIEPIAHQIFYLIFNEAMNSKVIENVDQNKNVSEESYVVFNYFFNLFSDFFPNNLNSTRSLLKCVSKNHKSTNFPKYVINSYTLKNNYLKYLSVLLKNFLTPPMKLYRIKSITSLSYFYFTEPYIRLLKNNLSLLRINNDKKFFIKIFNAFFNFFNFSFTNAVYYSFGLDFFYSSLYNFFSFFIIYNNNSTFFNQSLVFNSNINLWSVSQFSPSQNLSSLSNKKNFSTSSSYIPIISTRSTPNHYFSTFSGSSTFSHHYQSENFPNLPQSVTHNNVIPSYIYPQVMIRHNNNANNNLSINSSPSPYSYFVFNPVSFSVKNPFFPMSSLLLYPYDNNEEVEEIEDEDEDIEEEEEEEDDDVEKKENENYFEKQIKSSKKILNLYSNSNNNNTNQSNELAISIINKDENLIDTEEEKESSITLVNYGTIFPSLIPPLPIISSVSNTSNSSSSVSPSYNFFSPPTVSSNYLLPYYTYYENSIFLKLFNNLFSNYFRKDLVYKNNKKSKDNEKYQNLYFYFMNKINYTRIIKNNISNFKPFYSLINKKIASKNNYVDVIENIFSIDLSYDFYSKFVQNLFQIKSENSYLECNKFFNFFNILKEHYQNFSNGEFELDENFLKLVFEILLNYNYTFFIDILNKNGNILRGLNNEEISSILMLILEDDIDFIEKIYNENFSMNYDSFNLKTDFDFEPEINYVNCDNIECNEDSLMINKIDPYFLNNFHFLPRKMNLSSSYFHHPYTSILLPLYISSFIKPLPNGGDVLITHDCRVKSISHFPTVILSHCKLGGSLHENHANSEEIDNSNLKFQNSLENNTKNLFITGKWYYECELLSEGLIQIGWASFPQILSPESDSSSLQNPLNAFHNGGMSGINGQGVGDFNNSWGFDGLRMKRWSQGGWETLGVGMTGGRNSNSCYTIGGEVNPFIINESEIKENSNQNINNKMNYVNNDIVFTTCNNDGDEVLNKIQHVDTEVIPPLSINVSNNSRWQIGDIIGCLLDLDLREIRYFINGEPLLIKDTNNLLKGSHQQQQQQQQQNRSSNSQNVSRLSRQPSQISEADTLNSSNDSTSPLPIQRHLRTPSINNTSGSILTNSLVTNNSGLSNLSSSSSSFRAPNNVVVRRASINLDDILKVTQVDDVDIEEDDERDKRRKRRSEKLDDDDDELFDEFSDGETYFNTSQVTNEENNYNEYYKISNDADTINYFEDAIIDNDGVAFQNFNISSPLYPTISLNIRQSIKINFGQSEFAFKPLISDRVIKPVIFAMVDDSGLPFFEIQDNNKSKQELTSVNSKKNSGLSNEDEEDDEDEDLLKYYSTNNSSNQLISNFRDTNIREEPIEIASNLQSNNISVSSIQNSNQINHPRFTPPTERLNPQELFDGLLSMGFPSHWAARAVNQPNVTTESEAINFIITIMEEENNDSSNQSNSLDGYNEEVQLVRNSLFRNNHDEQDQYLDENNTSTHSENQIIKLDEVENSESGDLLSESRSDIDDKEDFDGNYDRDEDKDDKDEDDKDVDDDKDGDEDEDDEEKEEDDRDNNLLSQDNFRNRIVNFHDRREDEDDNEEDEDEDEDEDDEEDEDEDDILRYNDTTEVMYLLEQQLSSTLGVGNYLNRRLNEMLESNSDTFQANFFNQNHSHNHEESLDNTTSYHYLQHLQVQNDLAQSGGANSNFFLLNSPTRYDGINVLREGNNQMSSSTNGENQLNTINYILQNNSLATSLKSVPSSKRLTPPEIIAKILNSPSSFPYHNLNQQKSFINKNMQNLGFNPVIHDLSTTLLSQLPSWHFNSSISSSLFPSYSSIEQNLSNYNNKMYQNILENFYRKNFSISNLDHKKDFIFNILLKNILLIKIIYNYCQNILVKYLLDKEIFNTVFKNTQLLSTLSNNKLPGIFYNYFQKNLIQNHSLSTKSSLSSLNYFYFNVNSNPIFINNQNFLFSYLIDKSMNYISPEDKSSIPQLKISPLLYQNSLNFYHFYIQKHLKLPQHLHHLNLFHTFSNFSNKNKTNFSKDAKFNNNILKDDIFNEENFNKIKNNFQFHIINSMPMIEPFQSNYMLRFMRNIYLGSVSETGDTNKNEKNDVFDFNFDENILRIYRNFFESKNISIVLIFFKYCINNLILATNSLYSTTDWISLSMTKRGEYDIVVTKEFGSTKIGLFNLSSDTKENSDFKISYNDLPNVMFSYWTIKRFFMIIKSYLSLKFEDYNDLNSNNLLYYIKNFGLKKLFTNLLKIFVSNSSSISLLFFVLDILNDLLNIIFIEVDFISLNSEKFILENKWYYDDITLFLTKIKKLLKVYNIRNNDSKVYAKLNLISDNLLLNFNYSNIGSHLLHATILFNINISNLFKDEISNSNSNLNSLSLDKSFPQISSNENNNELTSTNQPQLIIIPSNLEDSFPYLLQLSQTTFTINWVPHFNKDKIELNIAKETICEWNIEIYEKKISNWVLLNNFPVPFSISFNSGSDYLHKWEISYDSIVDHIYSEISSSYSNISTLYLPEIALRFNNLHADSQYKVIFNPLNQYLGLFDSISFEVSTPSEPLLQINSDWFSSNLQILPNPILMTLHPYDYIGNTNTIPPSPSNLNNIKLNSNSHSTPLNFPIIISNRVNKKWSSATLPIPLTHGTYSWTVQINRCISKNIFIGVKKSIYNNINSNSLVQSFDPSPKQWENYVGSDQNSWGFLANKAIWHNKNRSLIYGELFKTGDVIRCVLSFDEDDEVVLNSKLNEINEKEDLNTKNKSDEENKEDISTDSKNKDEIKPKKIIKKRIMNYKKGAKLYYYLNNEYLGVAVDELKGPLYPSFSLYNENDQITISNFICHNNINKSYLPTSSIIIKNYSKISNSNYLLSLCSIPKVDLNNNIYFSNLPSGSTSINNASIKKFNSNSSTNTFFYTLNLLISHINCFRNNIISEELFQNISLRFNLWVNFDFLIRYVFISSSQISDDAGCLIQPIIVPNNASFNLENKKMFTYIIKNSILFPYWNFKIGQIVKLEGGLIGKIIGWSGVVFAKSNSFSTHASKIFILLLSGSIKSYTLSEIEIMQESNDFELVLNYNNLYYNFDNKIDEFYLPINKEDTDKNLNYKYYDSFTNINNIIDDNIDKRWSYELDKLLFQICLYCIKSYNLINPFELSSINFRIFLENFKLNINKNKIFQTNSNIENRIEDNIILTLKLIHFLLNNYTIDFLILRIQIIYSFNDIVYSLLPYISSSSNDLKNKNLIEEIYYYNDIMFDYIKKIYILKINFSKIKLLKNFNNILVNTLNKPTFSINSPILLSEKFLNFSKNSLINYYYHSKNFLFNYNNNFNIHSVQNQIIPSKTPQIVKNGNSFSSTLFPQVTHASIAFDNFNTTPSSTHPNLSITSSYLSFSNDNVSPSDHFPDLHQYNTNLISNDSLSSTIDPILCESNYNINENIVFPSIIFYLEPQEFLYHNFLNHESLNENQWDSDSDIEELENIIENDEHSKNIALVQSSFFGQFLYFSMILNLKFNYLINENIIANSVSVSNPSESSQHTLTSLFNNLPYLNSNFNILEEPLKTFGWLKNVDSNFNYGLIVKPSNYYQNFIRYAKKDYLFNEIKGIYTFYIINNISNESDNSKFLNDEKNFFTDNNLNFKIFFYDAIEQTSVWINKINFNDIYLKKDNHLNLFFSSIFHIIGMFHGLAFQRNLDLSLSTFVNSENSNKLNLFITQSYSENISSNNSDTYINYFGSSFWIGFHSIVTESLSIDLWNSERILSMFTTGAYVSSYKLLSILDFDVELPVELQKNFKIAILSLSHEELLKLSIILLRQKLSLNSPSEFNDAIELYYKFIVSSSINSSISYYSFSNKSNILNELKTINILPYNSNLNLNPTLSNSSIFKIFFSDFSIVLNNLTGSSFQQIKNELILFINYNYEES